MIRLSLFAKARDSAKYLFCVELTCDKIDNCMYNIISKILNIDRSLRRIYEFTYSRRRFP